MSASSLTTARHPSAAIAWATKESLFVELPCQGSAPYITRYPLTASGLQAALNILLDNPEPAPRKPEAAHPRIVKDAVPDATREKAHAILKKMGII